MKAPIPLIFIHAGEQDWLQRSLIQARNSNPNSRVILLSSLGQTSPEGVEFFFLGDYFEQAATLKQGYEHFSSYDPAYELFCFQRWFVLRDFMRAQRMTRAIYLDSDVLTFGDLTAEGAPFEECDMTLSKGHCGHNAYINTPEVLNGFCDYCAACLTQEKAAQIRGVMGDVTLQSLGLRNSLFPHNDMRMLQLFREDKDFLIGDTALVRSGVTFDHDIGVTQGGFAMDGETKKLSWRDGLPYAWHTRLAKDVRFVTLHFKGPAKPILDQIFEEHCAGARCARP